MKPTFLLICFLFSKNLFAWSGHFLVTDRAFSLPEYETYLKTELEVEPFETFLSNEKEGLTKLFSDYYLWLGSTGSKRFTPVVFDINNPSRVAFLSAARLYPGTHLRDIRRLFPGDVAEAAPVSLATVSPWERLDKNFSIIFETNKKRAMSVRSILTTYSDEPDWEIDYDLWKYPQYGYGTKPYGKVNDDTSGAAFHMQFAHEGWIIRKFVPTIGDGLVVDRLELFLRLSRYAFASNHPYWGNRFAAWAIHYIQDMAQPYHAKAVPSESLWYYFKFGISSDKAKFVSDTTQLLGNRHYLYEDYIRGMLEQPYLPPKSAPASPIQSISKGPLVFEKIKLEGDVKPLFDLVSTVSAKEAHALDSAIQKAYGQRMTQDPTYDMEKDPQYDNQQIYKAPATTLSDLDQEAAKNLELAGRATRTLLKMCQTATRP